MDSLTASTTFTTNSEPHLNKFSLNKLLICIYDIKCLNAFFCFPPSDHKNVFRNESINNNIIIIIILLMLFMFKVLKGNKVRIKH